MPRRTTASSAAPDDLGPEGEPDVPPEPAPSEASSERGFFAWLTRLDLPRQPGWLGGVCAGVAAKIGVDPVLVRGVAVVVAVLGGPVALLYALAWFLLPDRNGTLHARELVRGHLTRALPGIAAVFLLSFLPLAQGFWFAGSFYWADLSWGGAVVRVLWTAALVAAAIIATVWVARRAGRSQIPTVPATIDDRPETVPTLPDEAERATVADPGEPPAPPADASPDELDAWKRSQDDWQRQRAAWVAEERRTDQERRRAEALERSRLALEASRERARLRRLTRPRARAGIVALVIGVALLAAAASAWVAYSTAAARPTAWVVGAGVFTLVLGVGIVAVALGRRRSGFLSFVGILSVPLLLVAVALPPDREMLPPGTTWGIDGTTDGRYAQLAGYTTLRVTKADDASGTAPVVDLWQYTGGVEITLEEGATVRLDYTAASRTGSAGVEERHQDSGRFGEFQVVDGRLELTAGSGEPDLVVRLWGGPGLWVSLVALTGSAAEPITLDPEPMWIDGWGDYAPTPTPTPTPTEGVLP